MSRKWLDPKKISRDLVLFVAGLLGVLHETLLTNGDRQFLLIIFAGMMGLPVFIRKDEMGTGVGASVPSGQQPAPPSTPPASPQGQGTT